MSKAADYLDTLINAFPVNDDARPADLPFSEVRDEAMRRLGSPKLSGYALAVTMRELCQSQPIRDQARLWAVARDTAQPRHVRARFAQVLLKSDEDRWFELAEELPDGDELLAFEGLLEKEMSLLAAGLRTASDLAALLLGIPEESRPDVAPLLETTRARLELPASQVYEEVLGSGELADFWPVLADALAGEGTPQALAALDAALLARSEGDCAQAVRAARQRLLETRPAVLVKAPARGVAFLSRLGRSCFPGALSLAKGKAHTQYIFTVDQEAPLEVNHIGTLPVELQRSALKMMLLGDDPIEVPFDELLAALAQEAQAGIDGDARKLGPFREALRRAPAFPVIEPGAPFSEAELWDLVQTGALREWVRDETEPQDDAEQLAVFILSEKRVAILESSVKWQLLWARWNGKAEVSARLAAHVPGIGTRADFLRLARAWARRFVGCTEPMPEGTKVALCPKGNEEGEEEDEGAEAE